MCGEQTWFSSVPKWTRGSPPRVRGTDIVHRLDGQGQRITPACAGNSALTSSAPGCPEDHPRVCGEQPLRVDHHGRALGSPPRVRGTGLFRQFPLRHIGITPACAGNSIALHVADSIYRDHPRVCGEQADMTKYIANALGSPPRVRGTDLPVLPPLNDHGITPACAGNSRR